MKKKVFSSLYGTILLAAIPSIIIFLINPLHFKKYLLDNAESHNVPENTFIFYDDLNYDGNSEKIIVFDSQNTSGITVYEHEKVVDQFNVRGTFGFILKEGILNTFDYNNDRLKEIYIFSISEDSILLHSISDFHIPGLSIRNRFIARVGAGLKKPDPSIIKAEADDLNGDNRKELIFGIMTGFSKFPRQVYAYHIDEDSLVVSPPSSGFIYGILQTDLNKDGQKEIVPYGYAANNISPEEAKIHDHSAWLMVLDNNLRFLFNPVEIKGKYVLVWPIIDSDSDSTLGVLTSAQDKDSVPGFFAFDKNGNILYRKKIGTSVNDIYFTGLKNRKYYIVNPGQNGILVYDGDSGEIINHANLEGRIWPMDIDRDGISELLLASVESSKIIVYRSGFRQPAICELDWKTGVEDLISLKYQKGKETEISFQSGDRQFLLDYRINPNYYLSFGIYIIVYLGFFGFIIIIQLLQKRRTEKLFITEKKITDLQLSLMRNQLDPHFTLNGLNSVIYSVMNSEKEKAVTILRKFSNLYRIMVLSAAQSRRTLEDELNFCNEYLNLEKTRLENKVDFCIDISQDTDKTILVPKMLIHFFAENAIKHAFSNEKPGLLTIKTVKEGSSLIITIEDNGIGRENAAHLNQNSTRRGYVVMYELIHLYNKYYKEKVDFEIVDLTDENKDPKGTKVVISLS